MREFCSLWVFCLNFTHGHGFCKIKWHKLIIRVNCHILKRRFYICKVMHTRRNLFPVPTKSPVQVFLHVHEGCYGIVIEFYSTNDGSAKYRANFVQFRLHCDCLLYTSDAADEEDSVDL